VVPGGEKKGRLAEPITSVPDSAEFLCIADLCDENRPLLVLEALIALRKSGLPARLTFLGDGPLRKALQQRAEELGLDRAVRFESAADSDTLDGSDQVRARVDASRAVVDLSPRVGGLPLASVIAMARARPVICARNGFGEEEVVNDKLGFLIRPDSVEALTRAMAEALRASTSTLTRMGEVGRARVRSRYDGVCNAATLYSLIFQHVPHGLVDHEADQDDDVREEQRAWPAAAE